MNMFKKVTSFTVFELIITLLISSIVISLVYYTFSVLNKEFVKSEIKASGINEFILLEKALQTDFYRSQIIKNSLDNTLQMTYADGQAIFYLINNEFVLRRQNDNIDTFQIQVSDFVIDRVDENLELVDKLFLNLNIRGDQYFSVYKKSYSSKDLMQAQGVFYE
jgi:hypothetical protein